ncbi:DEAD-box ATP-dependent RNA helicase CshB [Sporosarcina sp. NCCP-2222]|uniref:DEAD/DEAH box helicase n=1 Tax=Sporosarcina sp. NCCP-2222 TaxID=2935073 RepID=UPI002084F350|nr:DEAD/DEAH box helicase [Sporosarcina sp. NCCP-2222]GKV54310.1 DEAD-box ATP-dependent RNA helicase CshB [Sporosarcina sp. NCCP-2222]
MSKYTDYQFKPFLRDAISRLGFIEPTPIQKEMIPLILKGSKAIGQAHTGTGKSHSFLIPIVERMEIDTEQLQAVITAPTRELATQLFTELNKLTEGTEIRSALLIGGTDKQRTIGKLKSAPHVVVGTPGRIRDMADNGALGVHTASILVIDEADLAFDMGFIEDIDQFAARMPANLEMYVFSATIPEKLKPFLAKYMDSPVHIQIGKRKPLTEGMHYSLVPVRSMDRKKKLLQVLNGINPYLAIVFTNTKQHADEIADYLSGHGIKAGRIHGDLTPRERTRMMKQVRDLEFQYIVATDLAARGIDIPGVSHVINYELPEDLEFFIHRVGRTARAGLEGIAITLYEPSEDDKIVQIEKLGIPFIHEDIKNGEWQEVKERHARKRRVKETDDLDRKAASYVRKPDKVKPGYKKKMAREMESFKKRERRLKRKK